MYSKTIYKHKIPIANGTIALKWESFYGTDQSILPQSLWYYALKQVWCQHSSMVLTRMNLQLEIVMWSFNHYGNLRRDLCHVKEIKRVVRCYENANKTSKGSWRQRDKTQSSVNQNQLCFVHIFLIWGTLYNCYRKEDFPTGLVMKKCPNHSSFSLFWRLSVDINGISVLWILLPNR